jgi:hypothetical protein
MKKLILAAGFSLLSTAAFAQSATAPVGTNDANDSAMTSPNGVDSTTTGGQGTGAGANNAATILPPATADDNMAAGSMTPDASPLKKPTAPTAGANASATTTVNGVESTTTGGQGTGAGANQAQ